MSGRKDANIDLLGYLSALETHFNIVIDAVNHLIQKSSEDPR